MHTLCAAIRACKNYTNTRQGSSRNVKRTPFLTACFPLACVCLQRGEDDSCDRKRLCYAPLLTPTLKPYVTIRPYRKLHHPVKKRKKKGGGGRRAPVRVCKIGLVSFHSYFLQTAHCIHASSGEHDAVIRTHQAAPLLRCSKKQGRNLACEGWTCQAARVWSSSARIIFLGHTCKYFFSSLLMNHFENFYFPVESFLLGTQELTLCN